MAYAVVQRLADLAADADRRPRLDVPRIDGGVQVGSGLADQLAVMAQDVVATGDPLACRQAADLVERLAADLHLART